MIEPANITDWLPPPVGCRREHVAAIIEAATGAPLPCSGTLLRVQRDRMVAMAKAAFRIGPARKPRRPTLASVSKDARKAGIDPVRIEIKPDGSYAVDIGKPESVEPDNPWPLDEFRTKETKQ